MVFTFKGWEDDPDSHATYITLENISKVVFKIFIYLVIYLS